MVVGSVVVVDVVAASPATDDVVVDAAIASPCCVLEDAGRSVAD